MSTTKAESQELRCNSPQALSASSQISNDSELSPLTQSQPWVSPPAGVSPEARLFMNASGGIAFEMLDLKPTPLREIRDETTEIAKCKSAHVFEKLSVPRTTREETIGGVPVQRVIPQTLAGPEVVLYFFGGGFVTGSPEVDLSITATIAHYFKREVVAVRYRLSPEHSFPTAYMEAWNVYTTLHSHHHKKVFVIGQSAGGNLAVGLINRLVQSEYPLPLAVALLSPWIDLTHSGDSHKTLEGLDPTLSNNFLVPAARAYAGKEKLNDPRISPLFAEFGPTFPATVITTGTRDLLLSDCVRLASRLRSVKVPVELQITDGMWHVYEWDSMLPESTRSLRNIVTFLQKYLLIE